MLGTREIKSGGGVLQPVAKVWRRARSPNNEPSDGANAISHMDDIGDGDAFVLMYNYERRLPLLPHGGGDGESTRGGSVRRKTANCAQSHSGALFRCVAGGSRK